MTKTTDPEKTRKPRERREVPYMVFKGDDGVMTMATTEPEAIEKVHGKITARKATSDEIGAALAKSMAPQS